MHDAPGNRDATYAILDSILEGFQVLTPDLRYVYLNPAAARHARRPREELLGRTMTECFPGIEDTAMYARLERCVREQCVDQMENEFVYEDGTSAWFELRMQPIPDGLVVISLDVSERKRLEAVLRRADKLAALGQMAAGVAHNLGNILNPLALNLELLGRRARSDESLTAPIQAMRDVLRHGTETLGLLKDFSRDATISKATTDLNTIVGDAVTLCDSTAARREPPIHFVIALGAPPRVRVNRGEMLAAVVNLVTNSLAALAGGGCITIRTGACDEGGWLEVEDDGPGMSAEVQARAFEPFFTTKGDAGTGLGLTTVYGLAKRHGGDVQLRSAPGAGTTIRIVLPAGEPDATAK